MRQMRQGRTCDGRRGWRTRWILSLLAAALAACAALPAAASARQWSQPFDLSAPGAITRDPNFLIYRFDRPPDVGLDDNGNATLRLDAPGRHAVLCAYRRRMLASPGGPSVSVRGDGRG
jgi:hypothetical protein